MPDAPPHFDVPEAVYVPDGGSRFLTTPLAAGPWDPNGQHAGASAALLAHCMERHEVDATERVLLSRVTVDLLRPAPVTPLDVEVRMVRSGRRAHWMEAVMTADGRAVARATGLRLLEAPLDLPDGAVSVDPAPPGPDSVEPIAGDDGSPWLMFWHALDVRPLTPNELGPGTVWFRLRAPLIAGVDNTPLMRVMAAADFTLGISSPLGFDGFTYPNADLTVHLHRYPELEWVCVDAVSRINARGSGVAEAGLHDESGRIGTALQSLVVSARIDV